MNNNAESRIPVVGRIRADHNANQDVARTAEVEAVKAPEVLWTSEYSRVADPQGWNLFESASELQIQRDDEAGLFADDEAAAKHVQAMADVGDPLAIRAIQALIAAGSSNVGLYGLTVPKATQEIASEKDIAEAKAAGFQVQQGDTSHGARLVGRWWWTLSQPGWSEAESSKGDFDNEADAWYDAIRFLRSDSTLSSSAPDVKVIRLAAFGITVTVGAEGGGRIESSLHDDGESSEAKAAIDGVEALILAHAVAGIDVNSPAYLEGVETAVESIWNRHRDEHEARQDNAAASRP
jgi:hypothetical protein